MRWPTVQLSEISSDISYGVTASATEEPDGPKFLRITDIQEDHVDWSSVPFCDASAKGLTEARLAPGDIVFARTGATTGKSYLIRLCPEGSVFASYLIRVRPSSQVDSGYLAHFFRSPEYWRQVKKQAQGAAQPGVNASKLKALQIPLPALDEQKRIAAILDKADALRRLRQQAIDRLNTLSQSIFHEMFSEAAGWRYETRKLEHVCRKITDGTHQSPKWASEGVPFIFVSNIKGQKISLETSKFVDRDEYRKLTKSTPIERDDVLYTSVGSYGNAAKIVTDESFVFQRHVAHIKPDPALVRSDFLVECLETPLLRVQADRVATGIAQKTVTLKGLRSFEVPVPPLEVQDEFVRHKEALRVAAGHQAAALTRTELLFASLQQRAFAEEL
ncbi:MAG: restriction endonuclease subunit S [Alphaproteobacteria bacterium]|nr:restriction endonuclease subunit S [Alphaproteobacteria bacterium]